MPRRVKKIDNLRWEFSNGAQSALGAGSAGIGLISVTTLPETLMRVRGEVVAYLDGPQAPGSSVLVSMGIIVVPEGTGTTVLWDPFSDGNAPWLWYGSALLSYEEMVTDVIDIPGMTSSRLTVDNKAMRRVRPDEEVQFVVTNTTLVSAAPINLRYALRTLIGF